MVTILGGLFPVFSPSGILLPLPFDPQRFRLLDSLKAHSANEILGKTDGVCHAGRQPNVNSAWAVIRAMIK